MVLGGWSNGSGWQQNTKQLWSQTLGALNHALSASSVWDCNYYNNNASHNVPVGNCRGIGESGDIGQSASMCMCVKLIHVVYMPFSWFWHDETVQAIARQLATMPQQGRARCGYFCHHAST